jgi:hypothetical protein
VESRSKTVPKPGDSKAITPLITGLVTEGIFRCSTYSGPIFVMPTELGICSLIELHSGASAPRAESVETMGHARLFPEWPERKAAKKAIA